MQIKLMYVWEYESIELYCTRFILISGVGLFRPLLFGTCDGEAGGFGWLPPELAGDAVPVRFIFNHVDSFTYLIYAFCYLIPYLNLVWGPSTHPNRFYLTFRSLASTHLLSYPYTLKSQSDMWVASSPRPHPLPSQPGLTPYRAHAHKRH